MKNLLLTTLLFFLVNTFLFAQTRKLETRNGPYGGTYNVQPFDICGHNPPTYDELRVTYEHCTATPNCLAGGCMSAPPIRIIANLYRNGNYVIQKYQDGWISNYQTSFNGYLNRPGNYHVNVQVWVRDYNCSYNFTQISSLNTNTITVGQVPTTTAFNISGKPMPSTNYEFCKGDDPIILNGAASNCETSFQIKVDESNASGVPTGNYGWTYTREGLQAGNNIDLENLALYTGPFMSHYGSSSRISQGMIGGSLASSTPRYYRVILRTWTSSNPTPNSVTGVIGILSACETGGNPGGGFNFGDERLAITTLTSGYLNDKDQPTLINGKSKQEGSIFTPTASSISIIPHPLSSNSLVTIEGYTGKAPIQFEVYNSLGQVVMSQQSDSPQFDIQKGNLAAGIYVYRATAGETVLGTGKLSIQ